MKKTITIISFIFLMFCGGYLLLTQNDHVIIYSNESLNKTTQETIVITENTYLDNIILKENYFLKYIKDEIQNQKLIFEKEKQDNLKLIELHAKSIIPTTQVWGEVIAPTYGVAYATITCDNAGINAPLVWGDDDNLLGLKNTICQYNLSTQIGYDGCHLLAAHNYDVFAKLQYVSFGDIFKVQTSYGSYIYKVVSCDFGTVTADSGNIINASGTALLNLSDTNDVLYMYTCYPFGFFSTTNQRYVVKAVRI